MKQFQLLAPDSSDKRPKLERARSAAEKENQPLQRTGSGLRRQYSQQEPANVRRLSASDNSEIMTPAQRHMQTQNLQQFQQQQMQQPHSSAQLYSHYQQQTTLYGSSQYHHTSSELHDPKYYQV